MVTIGEPAHVDSLRERITLDIVKRTEGVALPLTDDRSGPDCLKVFGAGGDRVSRVGERDIPNK